MTNILLLLLTLTLPVFAENINPKVFSFKTMNAPTGTDPVASSPSDTLNFTSSNNSVTISGNSSTKTLNFTTAGGTVTSVTGTPPLVSSGGSAPNLTCNVASGSQPGCLSSTDWSTFNAKQSSLSLGNLTSSTSGVTVGNGTGAVVGSGSTVDIAAAGASSAGLVTTGSQTFAGAKTFSTVPILGSLSGVLLGSSGTITAGSVSLTSQVSGTLPVANGGSGFSALGQSVTVSTGATTIDLSQGPSVNVALGASTTFTFSNPVTNQPYSFQISSSGSYTIAWPGALIWPGGTAPTITASGKDRIALLYDGTNYWGTYAQNYQ